MNLPNIVSPAEGQKAREKFLIREEEAVLARAELAAERRKLPMVRIDKEYEFEGPDGKASLLGLFDGRRQLIVYRFFFQSGVADFPVGGCPGCSMFVDNLGHPVHLNARDTTLVLVSPAPRADIERFRERKGWSEFPWFTIPENNDFSEDFGVDEWWGLNIFIREGEQVYHTYFITGDPAVSMGDTWSLLDLTPFGQQEEGQDSPEGYR